jgi:hypothetical protein
MTRLLRIQWYRSMRPSPVLGSEKLVNLCSNLKLRQLLDDVVVYNEVFLSL